MNKLLLVACFCMAAAYGQNTVQLPMGKKPKDVTRAATYDPLQAGRPFNDTVYHQLPPIKRARYYIADTGSNAGLCYATIPDSLVKPARYNYRLPDYKGFEVYYMSVNDKPELLREEFGSDNCYGAYTNLIVYNPKTQTASVLTVYMSYYIDSLHQRYFYIDKNFTIYMAEDWTTDDDNGGAASLPGSAYKATITPDGGFTVKKIFEPK